MKKIVINRKFGGFGLSHKAIMLYAQKKGFVLYIERDKEIQSITHYYTSPEPTEEFYFSEYEIERDDPTLVEVVNELGSEANGVSAELHVVEIPDGVEWTVEEYDGLEHVAEVHRTWW